MSRKIRLPAMRVVKTGTKGGPHDDVFRYRGIGDFGISVFYGRERFYRPKASSLNGARGLRISWLRVRTAGLWTDHAALRRDSPHRSALRRYRLSLLNQRYRHCSHGCRFTPAGTRGAEMSGVPTLRKRGIQVRGYRNRV